MAGYTASNLLAGTQQAMTTSYKTLLCIGASSGTLLRRLRINAYTFGTDGTAADNAMVCDLSRTSADGTATSITPNKDDLADGTMAGTVTGNHTVEPTVTAASRKGGWSFNQRATQRLVVFPERQIIIPATNAAGLAFRLKSPQGYTGTGTVDVEFEEI